MKTLFGMLFLAVAGIHVNAQEVKESGRIVFDVTRKLEIKLQGDAAGMADMLPKERKSQKELLFTSNTSLYRNIAKSQDDEAVNESAGGATVVIKMHEPDDVVFTDVPAKKNLEQREFMTRMFLIETNTDTAKWKLTGNQREILGYPCMEAELTGAAKKTLAWFTTSIPVSTGPDGFTGLPGLILGMDIDGGKSVVMASSIELKDIKTSEIGKPKDGKKVSHDEYKKIVDDKMKEMNQSSGGGVFIIKQDREE